MRAMYYLYLKMRPFLVHRLLRTFQIKGHFGYCRSNITILLEVPKRFCSFATKGHTCDYTCLTLMIPQRTQKYLLTCGRKRKNDIACKIF